MCSLLHCIYGENHGGHPGWSEKTSAFVHLHYMGDREISSLQKEDKILNIFSYALHLPFLFFFYPPSLSISLPLPTSWLKFVYPMPLNLPLLCPFIVLHHNTGTIFIHLMSTVNTFNTIFLIGNYLSSEFVTYISRVKPL